MNVSEQNIDIIDPDYEDISEQTAKRIKLKSDIELQNSYFKASTEIKKEFQELLLKKQQEIYDIQQQLLKAQKSLHLLKYVSLTSFYAKQELEVPMREEVLINHADRSTRINTQQKRIHPALKKLIGQSPVNLQPYRTRNLKRKRHVSKSSTVTSDAIKTPDNNKSEITTQQMPSSSPNTATSIADNNLIRNRQKVKFRIIVGNISQYLQSENKQDCTTHKWMVYVRGPSDNADVDHIIKKVRFFLHPSYKPNDIVEVNESPFHLSRRGWGEFPLRVQLHFQNTANKPVDIIHNLKLDKTHSGRQTLGAETIVDIWIYDNSLSNITDSDNEHSYDFLSNTIKSDQSTDTDETDRVNNISLTNVTDVEVNVQVKKEIVSPIKNETNWYSQTDTNFKLPDITENLDTEDLIEENSKKAKENRENSKKKSISLYRHLLLKNCKFSNSVMEEQSESESENSDLIEDIITIPFSEHSYACTLFTAYEGSKKYIEFPASRFSSVRQALTYLLKRLPMVTDQARRLDYRCSYPYAASSMQEYQSWNPIKRSSAEWFRAKELLRILSQHDFPGRKLWTPKSVVKFAKAHAFSPLTNYSVFKPICKVEEDSNNNFAKLEEKCVELMKTRQISEIQNLKEMDGGNNVIINICDDYEKVVPKPKQESETVPNRVTELDENLRFPCQFVRETAQKIGINLGAEELAPGVWSNVAERLVLQAVLSLAEDLIRRARANVIITKGARAESDQITCDDVYKALQSRKEFDMFLMSFCD